jgi:hypothetical protein
VEDVPGMAPALAVPAAVPRAVGAASPRSRPPESLASPPPPKVEVHIDRIELAQPPPPPAPPFPPRGFGERTAARRFVDRGWV